MPNTVRITIDLPTKEHRQLKAIVALLGLSIQEYVRACVEEKMFSKNIPNEETRRVLKEIESGKNITVCKSVDELLKKLEEWSMRLIFSNAFKKDYKLSGKRGKNLVKLEDIFDL